MQAEHNAAALENLSDQGAARHIAPEGARIECLFHLVERASSNARGCFLSLSSIADSALH
jgi:hypothetical protein